MPLNADGQKPEADRFAASQQPTAADVEAFQRFCDRIGGRAKARGLTEEKLEEFLNPTGKPPASSITRAVRGSPS